MPKEAVPESVSPKKVAPGSRLPGEMESFGLDGRARPGYRSVQIARSAASFSTRGIARLKGTRVEIVLGATTAGLLGANRALVLVVLLALVIRVALFVAVSPWDEQVVQDAILVHDAGGEGGYQDLALGLLESGSFDTFGAFRTPGYPVFLAGLYRVFGVRPWVALLVQLLTNVGCVIMVYSWGRAALSRRTSIIAATLFAVEPHVVLYSLALRTETLFVAAFLASVLLLTYGLQRGRFGLVVGSGLLLGVSTLIRPIAQFFPLVAAGLVLGFPRIRWSFRMRALVGFVFAFLLILSPWLCRNYFEFGYAGLSSAQGGNLLFYNAAYAEVDRTGRSVREVRAELAKEAQERGAKGRVEVGGDVVVQGATWKDDERINPFENARVFRAVAIEHMRANWSHCIRRHVRGMLNTFVSLSTIEISRALGLEAAKMPLDLFAARGVSESAAAFLKTKSRHEIAIGLCVGAFLLITYLAAVVGTVSMLRAGQTTHWIAAALVVLYFSILTGVIGLARYRLPMVPFYIVVSAAGLSGVFRRRRRKAQGSCG